MEDGDLNFLSLGVLGLSALEKIQGQYKKRDQKLKIRNFKTKPTLWKIRFFNKIEEKFSKFECCQEIANIAL
jgi:hypothetical protein